MNIDIDGLRIQLKDTLKTKNFWVAVFIVCLLLANGLFLYASKQPFSYQDKERWSFGGPVSREEYQSGTTLDLKGDSFTPKYSTSLEEVDTSFVYADSGLAVGVSYPYSNVIPTRQGLKKYKVREGDTISEIAARFGVTTETIKYANLDIGSVISPGDEITILPVSGIIYNIKEGDTMESVAAKYRTDPKLIEKYNPEYRKLFESPGEMVILPYTEPLNRWSYTSSYKENLPNLDNYFTLPAIGWNWGELHYYNAVDIAADCGDPIYAAAEGLVIEESSSNYWNSGHGNYITIEHPNKTKTRYSHTLKNLVSEGDYVLQGEEIALIGNTGRTDGPTGCHLHFEVHGAQNPFAVK
jgi:murein DD-endopeptidase MepM/ murein hydrolase activator NlpD